MVLFKGMDHDGVVSSEENRCEETYMIQGECIVKVPKYKRKTCELTKKQKLLIGVVVGAIVGVAAFTSGFLSVEKEDGFNKQLGFNNSNVLSPYTTSTSPSSVSNSIMITSFLDELSQNRSKAQGETSVTVSDLFSETQNTMFTTQSTAQDKTYIKTHKLENIKSKGSLEKTALDKQKASRKFSHKVTPKQILEKTTLDIDTYNQTMFRRSCGFIFDSTKYKIFSAGDITSKISKYVLPESCTNDDDLCKLPEGEILALVKGGDGKFYCMDRDAKAVSNIVVKGNSCKSSRMYGVEHNKRFVDKIRSVLNGSCRKFRSSIFNVQKKVCNIICGDKIMTWNIGFEDAFGDIDASCKRNYSTNGYKVCGVERSHLTSFRSDEQVYIMSRDGRERSKYSLEDYNENSCQCEDVKPKSKFGDYMDLCIDNALEYGCKDVKYFKNDRFVLADKMYKDGVEKNKKAKNIPTFVDYAWDKFLGA